MYFNRFDICEAYAFYTMLWSPSPYGPRLHRIGYRLSVLAILENANENVKAIYGKLVRERERLYVAYERYYRRSPNPRPWPGTRNMKDGPRAWLTEQGLLQAVECYA